MKSKIVVITALLAVAVTVAIFLIRFRNPRVEPSVPFMVDVPLAQAPEVVELKDGDRYELTAGFVRKELGNRTYTMLAYNGSIPGPLIKVPQGAEVTINFKNGTDIKTLLHSHGVRMDNPFDGSQTTQAEMEPGGTFAYKLKFPDVGMYWYHPHVREDYAQELGLYGNYWVVPSDLNYWSPVNREVPLFVDDILIENGEIRLSKKSADRTLTGRFGKVMLINGESDYILNAKAGEVIRFYLTNAANTRTFNLAINGVKMKLVGGDSGAYEKEEWKESVILGPSERVIVEALFDRAGTYTIQHKTPNREYKMGKVVVSADVISPSYAKTFSILRTNKAAVADIDPFRAYFTKPIAKRISLSIDMSMGEMGSMMMSQMAAGSTMGNMSTGDLPAGEAGGVSRDGIEWEDEMEMMNRMSNTDSVKWKIKDQDTGQENMDIDWKFKVGDKVKIRITNDPNSMHPMQHPIHFHGQRFLVLDQSGVPQTNLVWKDTVLVPSGRYVDILLDVSNPGEWMAHCHIAEHLEAGMMMKFMVAV